MSEYGFDNDSLVIEALGLSDIVNEPAVKKLFENAAALSGRGGAQSSSDESESSDDSSDASGALSHSFSSLRNDSLRVAEIKLARVGRTKEAPSFMHQILIPEERVFRVAADRRAAVQSVLEMRKTMFSFMGSVWAAMQRVQPIKIQLLSTPSAATMIQELDREIATALLLFMGYLTGTDLYSYTASLSDYKKYMAQLGASLTKIDVALGALLRNSAPPGDPEKRLAMVPRTTIDDRTGRSGSKSQRARIFPVSRDRRSAVTVESRAHGGPHKPLDWCGTKSPVTYFDWSAWLLFANNAALGLAAARLSLLVAALERAATAIGDFAKASFPGIEVTADNVGSSTITTNILRATLCYWVPSTCAQPMSRSQAFEAVEKIKSVAHTSATKASPTNGGGGGGGDDYPDSLPFLALLNIAMVRAANTIGVTGVPAVDQGRGFVRNYQAQIGLLSNGRLENSSDEEEEVDDRVYQDEWAPASYENDSPRSENSDYSN